MNNISDSLAARLAGRLEPHSAGSPSGAPLLSAHALRVYASA